MKRSYHTDVCLQYKLGLLDAKIQNKIPYTTLANWRKKDFNQYFGMDGCFTEEKIELIRNFITHKQLLNIAKAIYFVYSFFTKISFEFKQRKKIFRKYKDDIINIIDYIKPTIGFSGALKRFQITYQQYYAWKKKIKCKDVFWDTCPKVFYNQLSLDEINTLKTYILNTKFINFSLSTIYYQMLRDKVAYLSLTSFYKYARLLNFSTIKSLSRRKKHTIGIRASKPRQIIHADVSIFRLLDNTKAYIYLIVDNYSRKILGWKVSEYYRSSIMFENLKEVYVKYNLEYLHPFCDLLVDDGVENKGAVDEGIINEPLFINKLIAQKDIIFSNSMIEAVNKRLKYEFLYTKEYTDINELQRNFENVVETMNYLPRAVLYGLNSDEVFDGAIPNKYIYSLQMYNAKIERKKANLNLTCDECKDRNNENIVI